MYSAVTRSLKVYGIIAGLLIVLALSHRLTRSTLDDLAPVKPKPTATQKEDAKSKKPAPLPKPMGNPKAKVKVQVYVTSDNECDHTTLDAMKGLHEKFGDQVYITYGDLLDAAVLEQAQTHKISCKSGLTINGKSQFILPERGLKGTVMLDGPAGDKNYNMDDVEAIVKHLLETPELDEPAAASSSASVGSTAPSDG